jgi:hypothetical protein
MIYDQRLDANEDLDLKVFEDIRGCGQIFEIFDGVRCVVVGVGVLCCVYVSQRGCNQTTTFVRKYLEQSPMKLKIE